MFSVKAGIVSAIKSPFGGPPSNRFSKDHFRFEKGHYFDQPFKDGEGHLNFGERLYFDKALKVEDRERRMKVNYRAEFPPTGFK